MRYKIILSYDGAAFHGWQMQDNAPSVQGCLEDALGKLLGGPVRVTGAGRTDTCVNAIGYTAHFDVSEPVDSAQIAYKLNAILPRGICVSGLCPAVDDFHARFDATKREYTYFLHRVKDPFVENFSYRCGYELDMEAMNKAASLLLGKHDFSCFEKVGGDNKTSICTVVEAAWHPYTPTHVSLLGFGRTLSTESFAVDNYLYFRIAADRFLRNMVRAIVGTLIEVGRGRRSVEDFAKLILPAQDGTFEAQNVEAAAKGTLRSLAGESVPGHALFLNKIEY